MPSPPDVGVPVNVTLCTKLSLAKLYKASLSWSMPSAILVVLVNGTNPSPYDPSVGAPIFASATRAWTYAESIRAIASAESNFEFAKSVNVLKAFESSFKAAANSLSVLSCSGAASIKALMAESIDGCTKETTLDESKLNATDLALEESTVPSAATGETATPPDPSSDKARLPRKTVCPEIYKALNFRSNEPKSYCWSADGMKCPPILPDPSNFVPDALSAMFWNDLAAT